MAVEWPQEITDYVCARWLEGAVSSAALADEVLVKFGVAITRNAILGKAHRQHWQSPRPNRGNGGFNDRPRHKVVLTPQLQPVVRSPPAAPPVVGQMALLDLRADQCRWPYGNGPFLFCGAPIQAAGASYCAGHMQLAYYRGGPR